MIPMGVFGAAALNQPRVGLVHLLSTQWSGSPTVPIGEPSPNRRVLVITTTAESNWYGNNTYEGYIGDSAANKLAYYGASWSIALYQGNPSGASALIDAGAAYGASYCIWTCDTPLLVHDVSKAAEVPGSNSGSTATVTTVDGGIVVAVAFGPNRGFSFNGPVTPRPASYWGRAADAWTNGNPVTVSTPANHLLLVSLRPE